MTTAQAALSGVLVGGLYAMMAMGVSLTWGMLKVINLAHFGLILIGAYLTYQTATSWGVDPLLTIVVTAPVLFVAGALLQWAFDRLAISELNSLLVSFGLLVIIIQAVEHHLDRGLPPDERRRQPVCHRVGEHRASSSSRRPRWSPSLWRSCSPWSCSSRCVGRSSAGHCAPSPRTVRSPPPSGSTTAGSVCCSPASPAPAPRSRGFCGR